MTGESAHGQRFQPFACLSFLLSAIGIRTQRTTNSSQYQPRPASFENDRYLARQTGPRRRVVQSDQPHQCDAAEPVLREWNLSNLEFLDSDRDCRSATGSVLT